MKTEQREQQWEQERNNIVLYGAALCRSDVLKSLCVCLPICVHASATEKEKKKKQPMRRKESLVPHHGLVSLSNLWQSAQSQGLKDTESRGKGSRG